MQTGPYRLIPLRARDGSVRAYTRVDEADYEWAKQWRWQLGNHGYAKRNTTHMKKGAIIYGAFLLHRELLGLVKGDRRQVDHINRDRLDNQRANLRIVTASQQRQNQPSQRGVTSVYRGVSWDKRLQCWIAHVGLNGHVHHLGCFRGETGEQDANAAVVAFRREHMPYSTD